MNMRLSTRQAFTLTEVIIAVMVFVVAVLVILLLLPGAMQAQQQSRYRLLAAMHVQHVMEQFTQHDDLHWRSSDPGQEFKNLKGPITRLNWDTPIPPANANGLADVHRDRPFIRELGRFDLERRLVDGQHGHYALPLHIARRLDSPDGSLEQVLDEGGYLYYSDLPGNGMEDMRALVWAVVGSAQHNVLPFNPAAQPSRELYPFPPQARPVPVDRVYQGNLRYEFRPHGLPRFVRRGERYQGRRTANRDVWVQNFTPVQTGDGIFAHDATGAGHVLANDGSLTGNPRNVHNLTGIKQKNAIYYQDKWEFSDYQRNNWEWLAYRHEQGDQLGRMPEAGAKWHRSLPYFRRLTHQHWLRLVHQLDSRLIGVTTDPLTTTKVTVTREVPIWRTRARRDGNNQVVRDRYGNPETERYQDGTREEEDHHQQAQIDVPGQGTVDGYVVARGAVNEAKQNKGYPAPANGLGTGHLSGTDILEEDAVAHSFELESQLRVSLPSLERRIMYRSAALALWASVAYDKDITRADDPNLLYVQEPKGAAPQVPAGKDVLLPHENPLLPSFRPPAVQDLHPAEVLALSYLAHAAMMVTGYKQPFYHHKNTTTAADDELLVDPRRSFFGAVIEGAADRLPHEEELPFRAREATCAEFIDAQANDQAELLVLLDRNQDGEADAVQAVPYDAAHGVVQIGDAITHLHSSYFHPIGRDDPANRSFTYTDNITTHQVPADAAAQVIAIHPDANTYVMNPYHKGFIKSDEVTETAVPNLKYFEKGQTPNDARDYQLQTDAAGNHQGGILLRRMTGGVINRFPPPYADRGAIDMAGERHYRSRWILYVEDWVPPGAYPDPQNLTKTIAGDDYGELNNRGQPQPDWLPRFRLARIIPGGGSPHGDADSRQLPRVGADSAYAAAAVEHSLAAAMAYISEHPYDMTVPRPMNRQSFADHGIYQLDVFNSSDQARRPIAGASHQVHPITFPMNGRRNDHALFGAQWAMIRGIDSPADYEGTFAFNQLPPPMRANGHGFPWGNPSADPAHKNAHYAQAEQFSRWTNYLHGYRADPTVKLDAEQAARCTAVRPFEAVDRCRQLVYWMVNWTQYEDFEAVPSAPTDAGRLDKRRFLSQVGEQAFAWIDPERTATSEHWRRSRAVVDDSDPNAHKSPINIACSPESGHWALPLANYQFSSVKNFTAITNEGRDYLILSKLGAFGADRNRNGSFDRGPVSSTTRMNATEIARFTFYDPVVWMQFGR